MKKLNVLLPLLLIVSLLAACSGAPASQETAPPSQAPSSQPSEPGSPEEAGAYYTVVFDKNTTPDDLTDDESFTYYTTGWDAQQKSSVVRVAKTDDAVISPEDVPTPSRKGYYFAGWHTVPVVTQEDIVYGVAKTQVFFGHKVSELGAFESAEAGVTLQDEAMYIKDLPQEEDGTVRLYARWVEAKEISDEAGLRAIADDLYGAYILTEDIVLSGEWTPLGAYFNNYTYYETDWWTYAFRGTLDGDGHTISGMKVSTMAFPVPVDAETAVWHDDGDSIDGAAGLFAAVCGATFKDLTLEGARIDVTYSGDHCYAAPLACFDMTSSYKNVTVRDGSVTVRYTDETLDTARQLYIAASGFEAGGWNSTISACTVENTSVRIETENVARHGGQIFLGGMVGESFATMKNSTVDVRLSCSAMDTLEGGDDLPMNVNVGGMSAGNTSSSGNTVHAVMDVSVKKPAGASIVNIGGYTGAQKYQSADNNVITADITTDLNLDPENGQANVGAVLGRVDPYYITLILRYASGVNCGASGNETAVTLNGEALTDAIPESGRVHLDGQVIDYVATRDFTGEDGTTYQENCDAVVARYGSYVPRGEMVNDILYINVD